MADVLQACGEHGQAGVIDEAQESLFMASLTGFTESVRQACAEGIEAGSETVEG